MMNSFIEIPTASHYWLCNGRVPLTLLAQKPSGLPSGLLAEQQQRSLYEEALVAVDVEVKNGAIVTLRYAATESPDLIPSVDLQSGLIWPCFVDIHTHLDKGHIWPRSPNPDGTFFKCAIGSTE